MLLHLKKNVSDHGPIESSSLFVFEDWNGDTGNFHALWKTDYCKPGKITPLRYTPLVAILILVWNLGPLKLKIIFEHKFSRLISIHFVKELVERI